MNPGEADREQPLGEAGDMAEAHRAVMARLLHFVCAPLAGTGSGEVRLVRGVLQPPGRPRTTRVVTWDGEDLGTSSAYDLPLTDRDGARVPWSVMIATLRQVVASSVELPTTDGSIPGGPTVPVVDVGDRAFQWFEHPTFDLTDALHAAAYAVTPGARLDTPGERLRLSGFLLLDAGTARLYVDEPSLSGRIGLDVALRDEEGLPVVGNTALTAALPSLVPDELEWNTSPAQDPYCTAVYDFTHW
ncbi:hypothetical protein [Streptomyces sp. NPDC095613]|uniref:hypothetical protein n=1 Tax=Streptomyces sp. NPDC095613 TaxID=3155540 RepID=UPI003332773C